jgi:prepilin-type N-terminal cleavage/methylation domain-containing protein
MKKTSGFTLVEVLAAVVVVTIGIVAMNQALMRCLQASRVSEDRIYVSELLERKMTELVLNSQTASTDPLEPEPVPAGYEVKVSVQIVKKDETEFFLHSLRAQGPLKMSAQASLLTAIPKKETKV